MAQHFSTQFGRAPALAGGRHHQRQLKGNPRHRRGSSPALQVQEAEHYQKLSQLIGDLHDVPEDGEPIVRRRPPYGAATQPCGPVDFAVPLPAANTPRNILEEIVWNKPEEISSGKWAQPVQQLHELMKMAPPTRSFREAILNKQKETGRPGVIAEVKRASPSRGILVEDFDPVDIAANYEDGGAACISVLTDRTYFRGLFDFLRFIRNHGVQTPLLCKDFIIDAWQIFKARSCGADCILLIAAVLPNTDLRLLMKVAEKIKMEVLIEVHSVPELERILKIDGVEKHLIGINNRDLRTFKVDLRNTVTIVRSEAGQEAKRRGCLFVGESGIFTYEHVTIMQEAGCDAVLVGESVIKSPDQALAVASLISKDPVVTRRQEEELVEM